MVELPRYPERNLSPEELAFGAWVVCAVFQREPLSQDEQRTFLRLYGAPGVLMLLSVQGRPVNCMAASELLLMTVPELREPLIEESARVIQRSLRMSSTEYVLDKIRRMNDNSPSPFERLKGYRRTGSAGGAGGQIYRRPSLETKKFLGRNGVIPHGTRGATPNTEDRPNED